MNFEKVPYQVQEFIFNLDRVKNEAILFFESEKEIMEKAMRLFEEDNQISIYDKYDKFDYLPNHLQDYIFFSDPVFEEAKKTFDEGFEGTFFSLRDWIIERGIEDENEVQDILDDLKEGHLDSFGYCPFNSEYWCFCWV